MSVNLQCNLDRLYEWAEKWQLQISYGKCGFINLCNTSSTINCCYNMNANILQQQTSLCDLGVNIDERLNFSSHIDIIRRKAHTRANLILRCFLSKNCDSLLKAFKVYVRPLLEYCSVIWSPVLVKDINALEIVQRQFTKRMPGMSNLTYPQRLLKLNIESLEIRRLRFDLTFTYKLVFGIYKLKVS